MKYLNRRTFISSSIVGSQLAGLSYAESPLIDKAGELNELNATLGNGIDLYIENKLLLIDGKISTAITVNGSIPGPVIRMQEGEEVIIRVHNRMDVSTSIHWHGLILPFTMDGVPGISFKGIDPGTIFTYRFKVNQSGTYWYHSHTGLQEQLGLYGMIIIDPAEQDPVEYDKEYSIVLSDWTFEDPHAVLKKLKTMEGYYNYQRPTLSNLDNQAASTGKSMMEVVSMRLAWDKMRMDPTDIADVTGATYSYLLNGSTARQNPTFITKKGQKVRLRIANASAMTYYDFRIPGLSMTLVQADGQNVKPVETEEIRISVAETYDVIVFIPDEKAYTFFAETMDRSGFTRGTLATKQGQAALIPKRRSRPLLTMADMGMMHDMGEMKGSEKAHDMGAMKGSEKAHDMSAMKGSEKAHDMGAMKDSRKAHDMGEMKGSEKAHDMDAMKDSRKAHDMGAMNSPALQKVKLPIKGLPQMVNHNTDEHGPGNTSVAQMSYRRYDNPGVGLGSDGWPVLKYSDLKALKAPRDRRPPTREFDLHLTGNMQKYIWSFDGIKWEDSKMIRFQYGERLRINMINDTMMNHPIHLHGMWMDLYNGAAYTEIPRKHTVNVQPAELLTVDITADAPGQWAFHCHFLYHMEMGMFRTVAVVRSLSGGPIDVLPK